MNNFKINFVIGAQRSGTTYLYNILDQHPQLCLAKPFKPEPKFFLKKEEIKKGKSYYLDKFYKTRKNGQILIEKSTSYIESIYAGKEIKKMFPNAKLLVLLRNPVERALSNYFFSSNNGIETRTLEEVFLEGKQIYNKQKIETSVSPFAYIERGQYVNYLRKYYDLFDQDAIGVYIFEELIQNKTEISKVLEYIGVDDYQKPFYTDLNKKVNQSINKVKVIPEIINKLRAHFYDYNKELEKLLNKDLSVWN